MIPEEKAVPKTPAKYAHVLRPLTQREREMLRGQLKQYGLLHALTLDQHGDLLDGHSREELCKELGIELRYQTVTTDDPVKWIKEQQQARRNLDREEMRALIAEQIVATPHLSNVAISKIVKASDNTVGKVRSDLVAKGKIDNVVRLETSGRLARGVKHHSNSQVANKDLSEPSPAPETIKPKKSRRADASLPPSPIVFKNSRYVKLTENIIHRFADDDQFHSLDEITNTLNAAFNITLDAVTVRWSLNRIGERQDMRVETRPAARNTKHYRIYRQGKSIGLDVLKAKFRPVIKDLRDMAGFPISFQTTRQFMDAVGLLEKILRDLEAE